MLRVSLKLVAAAMACVTAQGADVDTLAARVQSMEARLDAKDAALQAQVEALQAESSAKQAQIESLVARVGEHAKLIEECADASDARRNLQSQGPASQGEVVHCFHRSLSGMNPSTETGGGGGGHRRWLQAVAAACDLSQMKARTDAVHNRCCDEPGEDCTDGKLHSCNRDCAAVLVPLWQECQAELGDEAELIRDVVSMCPDPGGGSAVRLLTAVCPPGEISEDCIPNCDASTNGDVLLLNQNGNDIRLLCELQDFLYSWIGASALGGFLGRNAAAFVSAVISAAAGSYVLTLPRDADVGTDVTLRPGQHAAISGDPGSGEAPGWGTGGFTVERTASLSLAHLVVDGNVMVCRCPLAPPSLPP
jgi:hypothetical protein